MYIRSVAMTRGAAVDFVTLMYSSTISLSLQNTTASTLRVQLKFPQFGLDLVKLRVYVLNLGLELFLFHCQLVYQGLFIVFSGFESVC